MSEHVTIETLKNFATGELPAAEVLAVDDHLSECELCSGQSRRLSTDFAGNLSFPLSVSEPARHLNYDELEMVADRSLAGEESEWTGNHIHECEHCKNEVEYFRSLSLASRETAVLGAETRLSFLKSLTYLPSLRAFAYAGLFIVCAAAVGWIVIQINSGNSPSTERAVFQPEGPAAARTDENPHRSDRADTEPNTTVENERPIVSSKSKAGSKQDFAIGLMEGERTVGLSRSGRLVGYDGLAAHHRRLLENALGSGEVRIDKEAAQLRKSVGSLMSGSENVELGTFRLRGPVGEVVSSDTPLLSWEAVPGAESYTVQVFDSNFNKIASSGPIKDSSWSSKLPRGRVLVWQVTAVRNGIEFKSPRRPSPDASFKILSRQKYVEITRLKQASPKRHLILGLLYADAGMLKEALIEFESLRRANPSSNIPRKLAASIKKELGRAGK